MKRIIALILSMACANAPAFELTLTDAEREACDAEGGCVVISRGLIAKTLHQAYDAGKATCEVRL